MYIEKLQECKSTSQASQETYLTVSRCLQPMTDFEKYHSSCGSHERRKQAQQEEELMQLLHTICYEPAEDQARAALELAKTACNNLQPATTGLAGSQSSSQHSATPASTRHTFPQVKLLFDCWVSIRHRLLPGDLTLSCICRVRRAYSQPPNLVSAVRTPAQSGRTLRPWTSTATGYLIH